MRFETLIVQIRSRGFVKKIPIESETVHSFEEKEEECATLDVPRGINKGSDQRFVLGRTNNRQIYSAVRPVIMNFKILRKSSTVSNDNYCAASWRYGIPNNIITVY